MSLHGVTPPPTPCFRCMLFWDGEPWCTAEECAGDYLLIGSVQHQQTILLQWVWSRYGHPRIQGIVWWLADGGGGGGLRPQKVCVPKIGLHSPALRHFSDLVGRWVVGRNPRKARIPAPKKVSLSNPLLGILMAA